MALRMEWRTRAEGDDTVLAVEEGSNAVVKAWAADTDVLENFLNDMVGLDERTGKGESAAGNGVDHTQRRPQEWGDLVMSRADDGEVLWIDPGLYWGGIAHWFRDQGRDPHPYRPRR